MEDLKNSKPRMGKGDWIRGGGENHIRANAHLRKVEKAK